MTRLRCLGRSVFIAGLVASAFSVGTARASAEGVAYSSAVSGAETHATSTQGVFVGVADGQGSDGLSGLWSATVNHTPLCASTAPCAVVTGGTFHLDTVIAGQPTRVAGRLDNPQQAQAAHVANGITVVSAPSQCDKQVFVVTDGLNGVDTGVSNSGTGSLTVQLTHWRVSLFGHCITYFATVSGTLDLTL